MSFECVGINGYAGDRTPEAMLECHGFVKSFAQHFNLPFNLVGEVGQPEDLSWDIAILESKKTFDSVAKNLTRILDADRFPIVVTPRCATAIASLPVIIAKFPDVVVLYFDAHGDLNTPEQSESGYLGGMPIAAALGEWDSGYGSGLKTKNLVHIGGRDIDVAEQKFIEKNNILTLSKKQIERDMNDLRAVIKGKSVYIHLDTDVYDPTEVTAEYAVDDGLFRHHVSAVIDAVLAEGHLVGVEIAELSPRNDIERKRSYSAVFESFNGLINVL